MSSQVDDALDRLRQQINKSRATYVPGTPEKYPLAELRGLTILEAEALLAQAEQLREERDALIRDRERWRLEWQAGVKAAEAELERLRRRLTEGLREIAEWDSTSHQGLKAHALLAAALPAREKGTE